MIYVIHQNKKKIIQLVELNLLRDMLMRKFGREYSVGVMENREGCVSDRVSIVYDIFLYLRHI
jgi:hypothetical protein